MNSNLYKALNALLLGAIAFLAVLYWLQPYRERAAYLEGLHSLDSSTAYAFALNEGRSACLANNHR